MWRVCNQPIEAFVSASNPDVSLSLSLSLSMKMCVQRKAGRRQRARRRFASRLYPSHGPLRLITSGLRKTKRLKRRLRLLFAARYENFAVKPKASIFVSYVIKAFAHTISCAYLELWMQLRSLESTQESRVAIGCASSYS